MVLAPRKQHWSRQQACFSRRIFWKTVSKKIAWKNDKKNSNWYILHTVKIVWMTLQNFQLSISLFFILILPKTSTTSNIRILVLVLLGTLTPSGWILVAETGRIFLKRAVCNPTASIGWWVWWTVRTVHGTNDIESRSIVSKCVLRP